MIVEDEDKIAEDDDLDWTADWTYLDSVSDKEKIDEIINFLPGNVFGKVLALINQAVNKHKFGKGLGLGGKNSMIVNQAKVQL
ncbi:hypothetical protein JR316_0006057 [Psilocybe cubensis]|uniref:Uncharacterized protein n=1 Tax=Psilocybe cubensis TaxID=181762 RepID=A0ACB8H1C4_PSICU|nr:hypothetical protein JR316_0006057 [Psilocybe cubensis]KAH9481530.1 hypothetical protein JR316_0006057 [Psilocybe cubensis]